MKALLLAMYVGVLINVLGCDASCEIDAIPSDCGSDDEICDAETLTCEEQSSCNDAEDCPGGYVCYDDGKCARSCYRGFVILPVSYCKDGFTCTDDYRCVPE